jgi:hypothetical protein
LGSHVDFAVTNAFEDFTGKYATKENMKKHTHSVEN